MQVEIGKTITVTDVDGVHYLAKILCKEGEVIPPETEPVAYGRMAMSTFADLMNSLPSFVMYPHIARGEKGIGSCRLEWAHQGRGLVFHVANDGTYDYAGWRASKEDLIDMFAPKEVYPVFVPVSFFSSGNRGATIEKRDPEDEDHVECRLVRIESSHLRLREG